MTPNEFDTLTNEIRCVARNLLETCDQCNSIMDGTLEYVECEAQHDQAKQRLLRLTTEYGLYFSVPIFQQVEHEYRQQKPDTRIPSNAIGTLIEVFVGDEYDSHFGVDLVTPLSYDRGWGLAVDVMSLPPDLAKCIQEFPLRMASCFSRSWPNVSRHSFEQVLDDLVAAICRCNGIDVADTDLSPLGDYRSGRLGDAVTSLPPSLAKCIQDLPQEVEYRTRKARTDVNGYLFERLLYDLIDCLVAVSKKSPVSVVQKENV
jgi:hypothetical protein